MSEETEETPKYECPKCGDYMFFKKEWELKGKGQHATIIKRYVCRGCNAELRINEQKEK